MDFKYCPVCSNELHREFRDGRDRMVCAECGYIQYQNPLPAAAVLLVENDSVLLVKRRYEPNIGDWSLPAGFIEADENPEQAAIREVSEETGLDVRIIRLLTVTGTCDNHKSNIVLVVYSGERTGGQLRPGDDALEAEFFPLDNLPENIAFSSHKRVIKKYSKLND